MFLMLFNKSRSILQCYIFSLHFIVAAPLAQVMTGDTKLSAAVERQSAPEQRTDSGGPSGTLASTGETGRMYFPSEDERNLTPAASPQEEFHPALEEQEFHAAFEDQVPQQFEVSQPEVGVIDETAAAQNGEHSADGEEKPDEQIEAEDKEGFPEDEGAELDGEREGEPAFGKGVPRGAKGIGPPYAPSGWQWRVSGTARVSSSGYYHDM
jgi:hypothetical protein